MLTSNENQNENEKMNNYFPHDSNARNDERIIRLRMKHGAAGYGVYFMILERMRDAADYMCAKDYDMIAFDLRESSELIRSVVEDFGLFVMEDDNFYSESFLRRMREKDEAASKRREAGRKGLAKRYGAGNAIAMQDQSVSNAIAMQEQEVSNANSNAIAQKEKERKEPKENKKEKEIVVDKSTPISQKIKKNNNAQEENSKATKVLVLYNTAIKVANERYERDEQPRSCRLMLARKLTEARIKPLCNIADNYNENEIKTAFWNATQSMFCNGRSKDRSRPVDIDWLLKPEVFVKALENNL
jgi:hypothetical protein